MKAVIFFNTPASTDIRSRCYEMDDLPDLDETDRKYFRAKIIDLYREIDGNGQTPFVFFEPFETLTLDEML